MVKKIGIYCLYGREFGYGHLVRSKELFYRIKSLGILVRLVPIRFPFYYSFREVEYFDYVILDMREYAGDLLRKIRYEKAIVLDSNRRFDSKDVLFLYTLPNPLFPDYPWYRYFLIRKDLKDREKSSSYKYDFIITFGGGDPKNITEHIFGEIKKYGTFGYRIGIIVPVRKSLEAYNFKKVDILKFSFKRYYEYISSARSIITSFGNTLIEALYLKKIPIVINPTEYHNKLTEFVKKQGFGVLNLGVYRKNRIFWKEIVGNIAKDTADFLDTYYKFEDKLLDKIFEFLEIG